MTAEPTRGAGVRTVAVTGGYGLVGSACAQHLESRGFEVRRFAHTRRADQDVAFSLGDDINPSVFAGVDAVVHAAYAFGLDEDGIRRINVAGSRKLLHAAHAAGVTRLVFISSVSAFAGCRSHYGAGKLQVEETVASLAGIVLRPGLVYGERGRGLFGTLAGLTRRLPFLPVFDGGGQPMRLVHVADLAAVIEEAVLITPATGPAIIAHPRIVTFRAVLETIAARQQRTIGFVSLPGQAVAGALRAFEWTGLRLPFGHDNLLGLLHPDPQLSAVSSLAAGCRDFSSVDAESMGV